MSNQEAIKRRYTFGNDEFSLEAAYHDCKLVFDGITDDDSFQEADTGLILYYANEIIYALQEALKGKDINAPTNDCISRQAAIDVVKGIDRYFVKYIEEIPSAQPEIIRCKDCKYMTEHYDTDGNAPYWTCSEWDSETDYDGFCHYAERRTDD